MSLKYFRCFKGEGGFTLIDILVATALLTIVVGGAMYWQQSTTSFVGDLDTRIVDAHQKAYKSLSSIITSLREARNVRINNTNPLVEFFDARTVALTTNISDNPQGLIYERALIYSADTREVILQLRRQTDPGALTPATTWEILNNTIVARNVSNVEVNRSDFFETDANGMEFNRITGVKVNAGSTRNFDFNFTFTYPNIILRSTEQPLQLNMAFSVSPETR